MAYGLDLLQLGSKTGDPQRGTRKFEDAQQRNNAVGTVFIVDDDREVRTALSRLLAAAGYHVQAFESAGRFLDEQDAVPPGCLLWMFACRRRQRSPPALMRGRWISRNRWIRNQLEVRILQQPLELRR
jgi:hypothetical protein